MFCGLNKLLGPHDSGQYLVLLVVSKKVILSQIQTDSDSISNGYTAQGVVIHTSNEDKY